MLAIIAVVLIVLWLAWIFGISRNHRFYSHCPNCGRHITCDALHETQPSERIERGQRLMSVQ